MNSKPLMAIFVSFLALEALIIILYETNIFLEGGMCGDANTEFLFTIAMELITICTIPLALKLFKFEAVQKYIAEKGMFAHRKCAVFRMLMLLLPLLVNTMCYYLFMKVAFAYLAIILFISLAFIIPTKARCDSEQ